MLTPWKKSYDQLRQHIKKQRHCFANKGPSSQSYGFSSSHVWMGELDHKAEHWRIDAFELQCWRRLLRVPWTARRCNQSILEISPGISLEGLMLKLKLQYFGIITLPLCWSLQSSWCWVETWGSQAPGPVFSDHVQLLLATHEGWKDTITV